MNAEQFVVYLSKHDGKAYVGNSETLEAAKKMEEKGFLIQTGQNEGKPYFKLTPMGWDFVNYSIKRLGLGGSETSTKGAKAKSFIKSFASAADAYIQAYKQEHPVGVEDLRKVGGLFNGVQNAQVDLPYIEPMRLDAPTERALPEPKARKKPVTEYVEIGGKLYKKVDE